MIYVPMNTVASIALALPAAYAFSRYRFLGDKHLFFWLLSNRMAPAAVFALPFFQLYSAVGLFDTHIAVALAHCLFNVPLAVWILEGFMSGVPRELDELAFVDGHSFPSSSGSSRRASPPGSAWPLLLMFSGGSCCSPRPRPRSTRSRSRRR
jgi:glycerol transport system permease protein